MQLVTVYLIYIYVLVTVVNWHDTGKFGNLLYAQSWTWRTSSILLELKMPGMGGIEVLREIRADDHLRDLPVAVVTSSALESDRTSASAAGASDYFRILWLWTNLAKR